MEIKIYSEFEIVDIDSISIDPKNAKKHDQKDIDEKKASLKRHGFVKPVAVSKPTRIISAGSGMWLAAKELQLKKVPVIFTDHSEALAVSYGLSDNLLSDQSHYDLQQFNEHIKYLDEFDSDIDWKALGFEKGEIDLLLASMNTEISDSGNVPEVTEPTTDPNDPDAPGKSIKVTLAQREIFDECVKKLRKDEQDYKLSDGRCLEFLAANFLAG